MQLRHTESNARTLLFVLVEFSVHRGTGLRLLYPTARCLVFQWPGLESLSFLLTPWELGELECKQTSTGNLIEEPQ